MASMFRADIATGVNGTCGSPVPQVIPCVVAVCCICVAVSCDVLQCVVAASCCSVVLWVEVYTFMYVHMYVYIYM